MDIQTLIDRNRAWADSQEKQNPGYFQGLSEVQSPKFLWIGCSDSRVPANEIVGMKPGELFVHRNIANIVPHADANCLAVIEYAINALKVEHILVVGHLGCGGVRAALSRRAHGPIDNWLAHLKDIARLHMEALDSLVDEDSRVALLCRLNVKAQVMNVARTSMVQAAWRRGHPLQVHGWCYGLETGLVEDLNCTLGGAEALPEAFRLTFDGEEA
ncbi:MAG: carbonic anhydrase [Rhodospirillum sp.]|nr:carbonic anhydrase [Rhodospirillum sp.]MCF8488846.1 carbonic anhydrase [Rhodospirillum sp.]MCF8500649.1 carbonic anhydrase [Rhodospirillum sp.]